MNSTDLRDAVKVIEKHREEYYPFQGRPQEVMREVILVLLRHIIRTYPNER